MDSTEAVFRMKPAIRRVAIGWWNLHLPPYAVPHPLDKERGRRWAITGLEDFDEARGVAAYLSALRYYELTREAFGEDAAKRWVRDLPWLCECCQMCRRHCDCSYSCHAELCPADDFGLDVELCDECWPHKRVLEADWPRLRLIEPTARET